jgi:hypothetical protein
MKKTQNYRVVHLPTVSEQLDEMYRRLKFDPSSDHMDDDHYLRELLQNQRGARTPRQ